MGHVDIQHYHKNTHRLREGKRPLKNLVHHSSFTPYGYNFGRIIGGMHGALNSSTGLLNNIRGCATVLNEYKQQMQFPPAIIKHAIRHMANKMPMHANIWNALDLQMKIDSINPHT